MDITVLLRVHGSDDTESFVQSIDSILSQKKDVCDVLILMDPTTTPGVRKAIQKYTDSYSVVSVVEFATTVSRGEALRRGVLTSGTELVGVLDCGDISVRNRFRMQKDYLNDNSDVVAVGGYVAEFETTPDEIESIRKVPSDPDEVVSFARFRSPVNQPTVCFRRNAVIEVGNYRDLQLMEDYDLWVRLLHNNKKIGNIQRVLTKVKKTKEFYNRRGGIDYLSTEIPIYLEFYRMGYISAPTLVLNIAIRTPVRILPNSTRRLIYDRIIR